MQNQELSIIKQAIINELEGYEFYKMAMTQAEDQEVKACFKTLATEEQVHIEWLTELFNKIKDDPSDDFHLASLDDQPSPGIFKWDNVDRKHVGLAVSVFGIGIQMERSSIAFYEKAAANTSYPSAKALFLTLAKWEEVHLAAFAKEYDNLQGNWWSDQGYAPF
jgi:rubrerythrin